MPSSRPELIVPVLNFLSQSNPRTILDVGCGFGKFGFLAREYLGLWNDRNGSGHRLQVIDAIEVYEPYIGPLQRMVYDDIHIGDVCDLCESVDLYDAILMVEVIEHLDKDEGKRVISTLKDKSRFMLVTTPVVVQDQGAECGNDFEVHRSQWSGGDFKSLGCSQINTEEWCKHYIAVWG